MELIFMCDGAADQVEFGNSDSHKCPALAKVIPCDSDFVCLRMTAFVPVTSVKKLYC